MTCNDCNCNTETVRDPNILRAISHLVMAQTALEKAHEASEWADHDYALEATMSVIQTVGAELMDNPNLSVLAEKLGWTG